MKEAARKILAGILAVAIVLPSMPVDVHADELAQKTVTSAEQEAPAADAQNEMGRGKTVETPQAEKTAETAEDETTAEPQTEEDADRQSEEDAEPQAEEPSETAEDENAAEQAEEEAELQTEEDAAEQAEESAEPEEGEEEPAAPEAAENENTADGEELGVELTEANDDLSGAAVILTVNNVDTGYSSFADAVQAASSQSKAYTLTLRTDASYGAPETDAPVSLEDSKMSIDFNGHSLELYVKNATFSNALTLGEGVSLKVNCVNDTQGKPNDNTGNLTMKRSMNLNGGTLMVGGSYTQTLGVLSINRGTMEVGKDLTLDNGSTYGSNTSMKMEYEEDMVTVGGNLTLSTASGSYMFTNGLLTVKGKSITAYRDSTSISCKSATAHRTVFYGDTVKFAKKYNLGTFELADGHDGKLKVDTGFNVVSVKKKDLELSAGGDIFLGLDTYGADMKITAGSDGSGLVTLISETNLSGTTLDIKGNLLTEKAVDLAGGNLNVSGNVQAKKGMDLNGGKFTVAGDYTQTLGALRINKGTMEVGKDLKLDNGSTYGSNTSMKMEYEEDMVTVGGNLTLSTASGSYMFTNGLLTVKGKSITAYRDSTSISCKSATAHRTVFYGDTVKFAKKYMIGTLELPEGHDGKLMVDTVFNVAALGSDMTLDCADDMSIYCALDLNGHNLTVNAGESAEQTVTFAEGFKLGSGVAEDGTPNKLTINGKAVVEGAADLAGGILQAKADYVQTSGGLKVNKGSAVFEGNLYLCKADKSEGKSFLEMKAASDNVVVNGDMYVNSSDTGTDHMTMGNLYLKRDFYQLGSKRNFYATGEHRTVLDGANDRKQIISFESNSAQFGILYIPCNKSLGAGYELSREDCAEKLISDHLYTGNYTYKDDVATVTVSCSKCGYVVEGLTLELVLKGFPMTDDRQLAVVMPGEQNGYCALSEPGDWYGNYFFGWYAEPDFTGEPVREVPLSEGSKKLYARWIQFVFDPETVSIVQTKTARLQVKTNTGSDVEWTSSDPAIASVNSQGLVRALQTGEALITATTTYEEVKMAATCSISVNAPKSFQVSYQMDGGDNHPDNPSEYTELDEDLILLKEPKKENAIFTGWYVQQTEEAGEEKFTRIYEIDPSMKADITVYARWMAENEGIWIDEVHSYEYTGAAIKPDIRVYYGVAQLTAGVDYTVSYKNNVAASEGVTDTKKKPSITVKGKNNYSGTETVNFTITKKDIGVTTINDVFLALKAGKTTVTPSPVVLDGTKKLAKGKDYTLDPADVFSNVNNSAKPYYTCTITGTGNYRGTKTYKCVVVDPATVKNIASAKVTFDPIVMKTNDPVDIKAGQIHVTLGRTELTYGRDYYIENNYFENAGKQAVTLRAAGSQSTYYGIKIVTVTIQGESLDSAVARDMDCFYTGTAAKPVPEITVNGDTLKYGEDYRIIQYKNNVNAGTAKVEVAGRGKYSGKKTFKFKIKKATAGQIEIAFANAEEGTPFKEPFCKGGAKPAITVKCNGYALSPALYSVKYSQNTRIGTGIVTVSGKNFAGSAVATFGIDERNLSDLPFIHCPDVLNGKSPAPLVYDFDGKKLRSGRDYVYSSAEKRLTAVAGSGYKGEVSLDYKEIDASANIGKAKVSVNSGVSFNYTGRQYKPEDLKDKVTVTLDGKPLTYETDYVILAVPGNALKGKINFYVKGAGSYGGMKAFKVKINAKSIKR